MSEFMKPTRMMTPEQSADVFREKLRSSPGIYAISGPSGAGKDYLTMRAREHFHSYGIQTFNVQMTTERPHRGDVETKVCISPEEYTALQAKSYLVGDHVNKVRYGYQISHLREAIDTSRDRGGLVILELNPIKQATFPEEFKEKLGVTLSGWVGVTTTLAQTRVNMEERGESEETIIERLQTMHEFIEVMKNDPRITLCDNGPENRHCSPQAFIDIIYDIALNGNGRI